MGPFLRGKPSTASAISTHPVVAVWPPCHSQSCCDGDGEWTLKIERSEPCQMSVLNGSTLKLDKTLQQSIWGAEEEKIGQTKLFVNSG